MYLKPGTNKCPHCKKARLTFQGNCLQCGYSNNYIDKAKPEPRMEDKHGIGGY